GRSALQHGGTRVERDWISPLHGHGETDDLLLNGVLDELRLVVDAELAHEIELVSLDRFQTEVQITGNLLDRITFGEQFQHFFFARSEGIEAWHSVLGSHARTARSEENTS